MTAEGPVDLGLIFLDAKDRHVPRQLCYPITLMTTRVTRAVPYNLQGPHELNGLAFKHCWTIAGFIKIQGSNLDLVYVYLVYLVFGARDLTAVTLNTHSTTKLHP